MKGFSSLLVGLSLARLFLGLFFLGLSAIASAQTLISGTTTNSGFTLGSTGVYKLTGDYIYGGATRAIIIPDNADGLVLDLNGYSVISTGTGSTNGISVLATSFVGKNVVIKNGYVRGFVNGIIIGASVSNGGFHIVENVQVIGKEESRNGISILGQNSIVRNSTVQSIQNSTVGSIFGIVLQSPNCIVSNCNIQSIRSTISSGTPSGYGIYFTANATGSMAINNRIIDTDYGIRSLNNSSKLRDNLTTTSTESYAGSGIDAGGND